MVISRVALRNSELGSPRRVANRTLDLDLTGLTGLLRNWPDDARNVTAGLTGLSQEHMRYHIGATLSLRSNLAQERPKASQSSKLTAQHLLALALKATCPSKAPCYLVHVELLHNVTACDSHTGHFQGYRQRLRSGPLRKPSE